MAPVKTKHKALAAARISHITLSPVFCLQGFHRIQYVVRFFCFSGPWPGAVLEKNIILFGISYWLPEGSNYFNY